MSESVDVRKRVHGASVTSGCSKYDGSGMASRLSFSYLYAARPSFEYSQQVYFVNCGLQDESLQVTISKLP